MPAAVLRGIALGLALLVTGAANGAAGTVDDLYRATVFVTGQGEATRGPALARALAAGANEYAEPKDYGFMYQRGIADLDGHQWEVFFMDESQFPGA